MTTDSLLPSSSTPLERALESVAAARLDGIPVPLRALWDVDQAPAAFLPFLAWQLSVDEWSAAWGEAQQRAVIREAIAVQRRKGTVGAVRRALAAAGFPGATIQEGDYTWRVGSAVAVGDPGLVIATQNEWAVYTVTLEYPISADQAAGLERLLAAVAPARCRLGALHYAAAPWIVGDGTRVGAIGLTVYGGSAP